MEQEPEKFPDGYFEKKAEEYNIRGENLDYDGKVDAVAYLEGRKDAAAKPVEGEIEKTEEEIRFIKRVNDYINEQFDELGIEKRSDISPELIHILPGEIFKERFHSGARKSFANYDSLNQTICVDKSRFDHKSMLYYAIVHESLHRMSYEDYYVDSKYKKPRDRKSGYWTVNRKEGHIHFPVFNEIVTEKIFQDIINKHARDLSIEFNFSKDPRFIEEVYTKHYPTEVLDEIIRKISEAKQEKEEDVWRRFKRGYFTGEVMHLRDIERIFGKNALKVLSSLSITTDEKKFPEIKKYYLRTLKYFQTEDEKEREKLAQEILAQKPEYLVK